MKRSRLIPLVTGATAVAAIAGGAAIATTSHSASVSATASSATVQAGQSVGGALNGGSGTTAGTAAVARSDAALSNYWTPDRMRHAKSGDKLSASASTPDAAQAPVTADGAPHSVAPAAPAGVAGRSLSAAAAATPMSKAAGKVFFTDDGADWVCSGAVTNSNRHNVVATAGHCVVDAGANHYHTNWVFVPDYKNGTAPYGVWAGAYARTSVGWLKHGEFGYDVAFVNVHDLKGKHLQNEVGGEGITINQGYKPYMTVLGYPQAKPYNGETQKYCHGYSHRYHMTLQVELACHFTGGASGGPWLRWFKNGYGYLDGVSSNKNTNNNLDVRSPYFASWTWKMFKLSR